MQKTNKGDTWFFVVKSTSSLGIPTNFSGSTILLSLDIPGAPITEVTPGVTIVATQGRISITLSKEVMSTVEPGVYPYTVRVIWANGANDTLFKQAVQVQEGVPI